MKKVIPLDGDKLGMIGGMIGAILVLIMSLYFHRGDIATTLIRVGWAFVICYGATFFLVRVILRTTLQELIEEKRKAKEEPEPTEETDEANSETE